MNCDNARQQLNALADGEFPPWAAWRLRRHLAHCPACASELVAISQLTRRVRAWRDVPAPVEQTKKWRPAVPPMWSRPAWRPAAVFVGGCAVFAAASLLLPGQPARPTITFADVQRAMRRVNVVRYRHSETMYEDLHDRRGLPAGRRLTYQRSGWISVRLNPPATASDTKIFDVAQPYREVQTLVSGKVDIYFDKTRRTFSVHKGYSGMPALVEDKINDFTAPADYTNIVFASPGVKVPPIKTERTELNGRSVWKFVRYGFPDGATSGTPGQLEAMEKAGNAKVEYIWADPNTSLVLQVETMQMTNGRPWQIMLDKDFRYNEALPPGTFDLMPARGVNIIK